MKKTVICGMGCRETLQFMNFCCVHFITKWHFPPDDQWIYIALTLCLPRWPISTSVKLPRSPISRVIHTPIVHLYCSMKRFPLFLVRTVHMHYQFGFSVFSYDLQVRRYSELKIVLPKWRPNSSALPNNVAHRGFVCGKQKINSSTMRWVWNKLSFHTY